MAKKASGIRKNPVEILDDNGTLIATPVPGAIAPGDDEGEALAKADKRDIPESR